MQNRVNYSVLSPYFHSKQERGEFRRQYLRVLVSHF